MTATAQDAKDSHPSQPVLVLDLVLDLALFAAHDRDDFRVMQQELQAVRLAFESAIDYVQANAKAWPVQVYAGAAPYLRWAHGTLV